MTETTFTRSQIVTLLARSFTQAQLRNGRYYAPTRIEDYADCGGALAYAHWWGMLNDAALGDCPGKIREDGV